MKKRLLSIFLMVTIITSGLMAFMNINAKELKYSMDTSLSDVDASFIGEDMNDISGYSVDIVGDVNEDGYDDILIGAYSNDEGGDGAGRTYLIFGKASGWLNNMNLSNADATFIGENSSDLSGHTIAGAGDVNGDGYDDILIGAYNNDEGGSNAGQTYLIFGKSLGWLKNNNLSDADASFIGENTDDWSGFSIASVGDVNGDGYDDILIGALLNDEGGGNPSNFPDGAGQTYLIFGKATGWSMDMDLSNSDASFLGEYNPDHSGASVAGAGDVNGDGYDDILIGADGNGESVSTAGQTYLIFGKATGWSMDMDLSNSDASFLGENKDGFSGDAVCGAGDVNGDGYDDILIGALGNNEGGYWAGQSYLIFGKDTGWTMDVNLSNVSASFIGEESDDWSGNSVAGAGDVNGDGYDDILIGANWNDEGGLDGGQTYLILGKESGWFMDTNLSNVDASFIGENIRDYSGESVAGGGDVNGDSYDDIIIGAKWNDDGGHDAGKTYLIFPDNNSRPSDVDQEKDDTIFIIGIIIIIILIVLVIYMYFRMKKMRR
jgi:hypothetical protein